MHRSPRMILSRTVFNHCKWIYIELAITSAHSGMGPLCISPAPTPAARARANVFPISSLRAVPTAAAPRLPESSLVPSPTLPRACYFVLSSRFSMCSCSVVYHLQHASLCLAAIFLQGSSRSQHSSFLRAPIFPFFLLV